MTDHKLTPKLWRVGPELAERLAAAAQREDRSQAAIVRRALAAYLDLSEQGKTL